MKRHATMKNINSLKFIKTLAMLLMVTGLSVACAVRLKPAYITGLSFAKQPSAPPIIAVPLGTQTDRGLQLTLNAVLFEVDKAILLPEGHRQVEKFAQTIQHYSSRTVLIEGHTDNTGKKTYNKNLSKRRAKTVRDTLIAKGINPERLVIKAFGEAKPIAPNSTKAGRQQNRRVEIIILNEGETP